MGQEHDEIVLQVSEIAMLQLRRRDAQPAPVPALLAVARHRLEARRIRQGKAEILRMFGEPGEGPVFREVVADRTEVHGGAKLVLRPSRFGRIALRLRLAVGGNSTPEDALLVGKGSVGGRDLEDDPLRLRRRAHLG